MSLRLAGYPKTPGFDVQFGSFGDMTAAPRDVRLGAMRKTSARRIARGKTKSGAPPGW